MFSWVWKLLYGISKSMFQIIDYMLKCANMLVGIQPIYYQGSETDFLSYLLGNRNVMYAFIGASIVSVVLVVVFGIFMILRTIASEKVEKTPAQIAIQIGKTVLMFLFIPAAFTILLFFTNKIMTVLYSTTTGGSTDGIGRFLAGTFGMNARVGEWANKDNYYLSDSFDYTSYSSMNQFLDMSEYDYFFSWFTSIVIILALGLVLVMFVDRAISIVMLFILSPISLSTTVIDDGARFKLWRDQFITKLLTGYGCIIAINIYAIIISAISSNDLRFFGDGNGFLNNFMKLFIIIGGAVSLTKMMALIGNLIAAGAGSNEMRDSALAMAGVGRVAGNMWGAAKMPFRAGRGVYNFSRDVANRGLGHAIGSRLGFRTSRDYQMEKGQLALGKKYGGGGGSSEGVGAANNKAGAGAKDLKKGGESVKNVIGGAANNKAGGANGKGSNALNQGAAGGQGSNMVNNAIDNSMHGQRKRSKSFDDK